MTDSSNTSAHSGGRPSSPRSFTRAGSAYCALRLRAHDDPQSVVIRFFDDNGLDITEDAQRKIVIGSGGDRIKKIGVAARRAIEDLLGRRVHLGLFVRTEEAWSDDERKLP